jgi:transposase
MGWSGRAPVPPAIEAGKGRAKDKQHAMSQTPKPQSLPSASISARTHSTSSARTIEARLDCARSGLRDQLEARFANKPPCLIGMEAGVGAHHLSRKLKALGHDAPTDAGEICRPYSKGQKNDFRDAEASG